MDFWKLIRAKRPRDDLPGQEFTQQAVGERLRDPYTDVIACCGLGTAVDYEIQGLVLGGTPDDLFAGLVLAFNHYFNLLTQVAAIALALDLALVFLQDLQAVRFLNVGNGVGVLQRGRVGPRRVLERENPVVADLREQREGFAEFLLGFAGKADDDVGGEADLALGGLHPGDTLEVFFASVLAKHGVEYTG